jgi:AcrR family transcriptional regulator
MTPTGELDGPAAMRRRIATAARDLFAARGYEQTTVDANAERAGVGRRTVFRHFRSKDDAIFPDHDAIEQQVVATMLAADTESPMRAVCAGARVVFQSYVAEPVISVERYRVARSEPALRAREASGVTRYTRAFSRHLVLRYSSELDLPDSAIRLRADVAASALVAAHNQVLREWLVSGGVGDPLPALDAAFEWVISRFERTVDGTASAQSSAASGRPGEGGRLLVAVLGQDESADAVLARVRGVL